MTRMDIVHKIAKDLNVTDKYVKELVLLYEKEIADALNAGKTVKLPNFARFEVYAKKGSSRYNIAAKANVYMPTKYRVRITAIGDLKESVESQPVSKFDKTKNDVDFEEGDD